MNEKFNVNLTTSNPKHIKELKHFTECLNYCVLNGATRVSWFIVPSDKAIDFANNQKVIQLLRTMYPKQPFWKAFKKLKGKYFWIGAVTSAVACGVTYFAMKKSRKKKFAERMLKVQETYSEEPIDRYFEMVGVMEDELKDLGYHFEILDNSFKEDV